MNSLRTKTTLLTVGAVVITMAVLTCLAAYSIKDLGNSSSASPARKSPSAWACWTAITSSR